MYANYEFYTGDDFYGVAITEDDFPRLCSRASDFVDYYTQGKASKADDPKVVTAIKKACCAVAEKMLEMEQAAKLRAQYIDAALNGGEKKSETVGSWSVSYSTAADYARSEAELTNPRAQYAQVALEYLANTGLLYRGGCCL